MVLKVDVGSYYMKFCPRCGSPNIEWVLPQDWSKWDCKDCGYIGPLIIEDGKIAEELRNEYQKRIKNKINIEDKSDHENCIP